MIQQLRQNGQTKQRDVIWQNVAVTRAQREKLNGHRSVAVWFTGLSGSGKSTLAHAVDKELYRLGCCTYVFDGDNVRHGLCCDLGFSVEDRQENIRRIGEMTRLFVEAGVIALTAFISPIREDRQKVRDLLGPDDFVEIYVKCPLNVCENRDVKGLYKKARAGVIQEFTGISAPYEVPEIPDLVIETARQSVEDSVSQVIDYLLAKGLMLV